MAKNLGRWLTGALVTVLLLAVLLWGLAPFWLKPLASHFTPEPWQLLDMQIKRPGLSGITVPAARARGRVAGLDLEISLQDAQLTWAGPALQLDTARLALIDGPPGELPEDGAPIDLSLPRLLLPAGLPELRINTLELVDARQPLPREWTLRDLVLNDAGAGLQLQTTLNRPAPLSGDLALDLSVSGQSIELTARDPAAPQHPLLRFSQTADARDSSRATGELAWDIDLDRLAVPELNGLLALPKSATLEGLSGRVGGTLRFEGTDALALQSGALQFNRLKVDSQAGELDATVMIKLQARDVDLALQVEDLSIRGQGVQEDIIAPLLGALNTLLNDAGISALDAGGPASFTLGSEPGADGTRLQATIALAQPHALDLSGPVNIGWLQEGSLALNAQLPDLEARATLQAPAALEALSTSVAGDFSLQQPLSRTADGASMGFSAATGRFELKTAWGGPDLDINGTLSDLRLEGVSYSSPAFTMSLGELNVNGQLSTLPGWRFVGPLQGRRLVLAGDESPLAPPLLSAGSLNMDMDLRLQDDGDLNATVILNAVSLPLAAATVSQLEMQVPALDINKLSGTVRILTSGLSSELGGAQRSGIDFDLQGNLSDGQRYSGAGELLLGYQAALPFDFAADLAAASGSVTLKDAAIPAAGLASLQAPLGISLPEGVRFDQGQLVLNGALTVRDGVFGGRMAVRGEQLGMSFGESSLQSLDFSTQFDLAEVLTGKGTVSLALASLAAGLELVSLSTQVDVASSDNFGAEQLRAQLLGGRLFAPSVRLVSGRVQDSELSWEGFDLARLLEFVDVNGLDGTGTVDARMPLVAEENGLAVRNGTFAARGPGRLRYNSGVPAGNIGLQALENFEYENLSGTLDYGSDGAYSIGVDLLGRNPDLYGGHPIRFRLQLGGAMPALFRSLFVTGDFDRAIIERLRSGTPLLGETDSEGEP